LQQHGGLGLLNGFVYRVSRCGSTSCWLHHSQRTLAALPDRHRLRKESSKLVDGQFKPLDGDAVRSDTANRRSVQEIGSMGFAGDALLLPFHNLTGFESGTPPSLQRHGHFPTWFVVKGHGCLLRYGAWPNQRVSWVSRTFSLIVCDLELPIMWVLCLKLTIARTGLRGSSRSSPLRVTPIKRPTTRSYDPSSLQNLRDIESGSRGRGGIMVRSQRGNGDLVSDFVPVGPVCSSDSDGTSN